MNTNTSFYVVVDVPAVPHRKSRAWLLGSESLRDKRRSTFCQRQKRRFLTQLAVGSINKDFSCLPIISNRETF